MNISPDFIVLVNCMSIFVCACSLFLAVIWFFDTPLWNHFTSTDGCTFIVIPAQLFLTVLVLTGQYATTGGNMKPYEILFLGILLGMVVNIGSVLVALVMYWRTKMLERRDRR